MNSSPAGRAPYRLLRSLAIGLSILAVVVLAVYLSGRQTPIDVVAVTAKRLGVPLESRMISTNGVRLHVVLAGPADGAPVLLLHGYPEFWWGWHEQIGRLARAGFRVIAPDQRGYDASDKPAGVEAYRLEVLIDDMLGLLQELRYAQVNLAGHDWGGAIAWYLALEHSDRVHKLVIFNAPHPLAWRDARDEAPQEKTINWFRTFFQLPAFPELATRAGNWWLVVKNLRDTSRPGTFPDGDLTFYRYAWDRDGAMHAMINWYRASFRYPHQVTGDGLVRVPTRIVWGMKDRFFESRLARLSVNHCANASLVALAEATHWLLHEEPERTSNEMITFFREP